jgi:tetratricopeptide (TPR) repeat protein
MGINASREGLERIEKARLSKKWGRQEKAWYELAYTTLPTLKRFLAGKTIEAATFENLCREVGIEDWESLIDLTLSTNKKESSPTPNIYDPEKWVGRSPLIEKLLNKFQKNTRIVWLTGLSGIGKTTLGECIAVKAWESDPSFQWIHLEISASQLTDFATGAREILSQLGEKDLDPQEMNDPKRLSDHLLKKLQSSFYWLQIDALEKLISANEFIDNYWLIFLESCLNTNHFPSRLLLTSQVLPNSLINWCDRFSNIWHQETLKGLENEEYEEYFAKNGIVINESNQNILTRIASTYEGHPLVLQVITGEILRVYQGDVTAYWKVNQAEFEQVSRELKSSRLTETDYNEQLARRVRERVKRSLEQLPEKAIALLCRSAVYRRPVPQSFWLGLITEYSTKEQLEAYRILGDRALIEKEKNLIRLHNLVRDIAYDWLQEDEIIWKATEVKAAELWLNDYQPEESAENLEKVLGYLEAFYHYCDAKNWEKAKQIIQTRLEVTSNKELHDQLFTWAYYDQITNIFSLLLDKLDTRVNIICHKVLAQVYDIRENYQKAIYHHHQGLIIAKRINDIDAQLVLYNGLSNTLGWENPQDAIEILSDTIQKNKNSILQIVMYCNLGSAYFRLNQIQEAIHNYQISLDIAQEINYDQGMANVYGNAAIVSASLGRFEDAEMYFRQVFSLLKKSEDCFKTSNFKEAFGMLLCLRGKYLEGIELLEEALKGFGKIRLVRRSMKLLFKLSFAYYNIKQIQLAQEYYEKARQISIELDISLPQGYQELLLKIEEEAMNAQEN